MKFTHILIDLENVKPAAADLKLIRGANYRVLIFHGPHQNKFDAAIVKVLQPLGDQIEYIQCERAGKNALDFHIAFYLGRMIPSLKVATAPAEKNASFFIVSKDSGFDVLLGHIRGLGYGAQRVTTVREALGLDKVKAANVAITPEPAAKRATPKKAAAAKPGASAKKKPAPKPQPAKPKAPRAAPEQQNVTPWSRVIEHLRDHPNNRPGNSKTLERHLATLLGKETSFELVKDLIARLQHEGIAVAIGKKIEYKIPGE